MVGVLLLGFVLAVSLLLCSMLQAGFPVVLAVAAIIIALMIAAGGGGMAQAIIGSGAILVGGLVLATASETYEEIRRARRRARPRRRPRADALPDVEPELHERSRAA